LLRKEIGIEPEKSKTRLMPTFHSSSSIRCDAGEVLAVHCSDFRFQAGIREFLDHGLQLDRNYDLLVIPGGPQCLTSAKFLPKFAWVGRKWFRFLVKGHKLTRLILIAHEDCGWYRSLPRDYHSSAGPRERQEDDLRRAKELLLKEFPGVRVELYYAALNDKDRVTVEPVGS
jgi:hypothetical protein